jgi:hypothetical protein
VLIIRIHQDLVVSVPEMVWVFAGEIFAAQYVPIHKLTRLFVFTIEMFPIR